MVDSNFETQTEYGSFSSGLVIGFLTGAVGYFISQTKEGKEIRDKFSSHWHELREALISEGKLSDTELDIPDYIKAIRGKIGDFLGDLGLEEDSLKKNSKKKIVKRKKRLFKGI